LKRGEVRWFKFKCIKCGRVFAATVSCRCVFCGGEVIQVGGEVESSTRGRLEPIYRIACSGQEK